MREVREAVSSKVRSVGSAAAWYPVAYSERVSEAVSEVVSSVDWAVDRAVDRVVSNTVRGQIYQFTMENSEGA